ncbi:MAG: restriction endonuclease subunit R, partial [Ruminococcus flavefaciens]|nr:restriction endonuclease subunit R [Ruminococcus flavefaciens]
RNDYYPRIAVTVDMIATGTDVKPIECLIFMRDVRSRNYFEQMKGRGSRTLGMDDLRKVTPSAMGNKDHFVIIDAVGVTESQKSDTRPLERKPTVSMKELMLNVALGAKDSDTLTSLANRVIRLNSQLTASERKMFESKVGAAPQTIAERLLNAFDEDVILSKAQADTGISEPTEGHLAAAQRTLVTEAVRPFHAPDTRDYIENVRRSHDQIIDSINLDTVLFAGYDTQREEDADRVIATFREFIEENKDEIIALRIIFDQKYADRPMAVEQLKLLYEKLKTKGITIERLWDCYAIKNPEKVKRGIMTQLTDLISIIRFEMGYTANLSPFADRVNYNFMQWTFRRNMGAVHFTENQMDWLRLIKEHITTSLSILPEDLDLTPFDRKGGLLGFYECFGDGYEKLLTEMNLELVA